jgi:hypothetical protein
MSLVGGSILGSHCFFTPMGRCSSPLRPCGTRKEVLVDGTRKYIGFVVLIAPLDHKVGIDITRYQWGRIRGQVKLPGLKGAKVEESDG